ncbi:hypothetical protein AB0K15_23950 [Amycolatopsis sp. NPDC049253]|uniref:alpha/beta fold hydrolase n=1 Tax=Amycolatopsis sp. NPDC049253 TaxID=3155274 RepID=UPI0034369154
MLRTLRTLARHTPERSMRRLATTGAGRTALTGMIYGKPERLTPQVIVDDVRALAGAEGFTPTLAQAKGRRAGTRRRARDDRVGRARPRSPRARPKASALGEIAPHARLLALPGCGHVPMGDAPGLVARVLLDGSENAG